MELPVPHSLTETVTKICPFMVGKTKKCGARTKLGYIFTRYCMKHRPGMCFLFLFHLLCLTISFLILGPLQRPEPVELPVLESNFIESYSDGKMIDEGKFIVYFSKLKFLHFLSIVCQLGFDHDVFLGNEKPAIEEAFLREAGIRMVLNCADGVILKDMEGINVLHLNLGDGLSNTLYACLYPALEFLLKAHHWGERVLVHCKSGVSRFFKSFSFLTSF